MESVLHNDLRGFEVVSVLSPDEDYSLDGIQYVLIDDQWPDWAETVTEIKRQHGPDIRCVLVTSIAGEFASVRAQMCGADGVYYWNAPLADLCRTFLTLSHGGKAIAACNTDLSDFSPSEIEVFGMLGKGMTTRQIAGEMDRAVKTIQTFILRMRQKLELDSLEELYEAARQWVEAEGE